MLENMLVEYNWLPDCTKGHQVQILILDSREASCILRMLPRDGNGSVGHG